MGDLPTSTMSSAAAANRSLYDWQEFVYRPPVDRSVGYNATDEEFCNHYSALYSKKPIVHITPQSASHRAALYRETPGLRRAILDQASRGTYDGTHFDRANGYHPRHPDVLQPFNAEPFGLIGPQAPTVPAPRTGLGHSGIQRVDIGYSRRQHDIRELQYMKDAPDGSGLGLGCDREALERCAAVRGHRQECDCHLCFELARKKGEVAITCGSGSTSVAARVASKMSMSTMNSMIKPDAADLLAEPPSSTDERIAMQESLEQMGKKYSDLKHRGTDGDDFERNQQLQYSFTNQKAPPHHHDGQLLRKLRNWETPKYCNLQDDGFCVGNLSEKEVADRESFLQSEHKYVKQRADNGEKNDAYTKWHVAGLDNNRDSYDVREGLAQL